MSCDYGVEFCTFDRSSLVILESQVKYAMKNKNNFSKVDDKGVKSEVKFAK